MGEIHDDVCNCMPPEAALKKTLASALDEGICYVQAEAQAEPESPTVPGSCGPDVWMYGEQHLEVLPGSLGRYGVPGLLSELVAAISARHREEVVRARLCRMGFQWFAHAAVRQDPAATARVDLFNTYAHAAWEKRYLAEGYLEIDPRWHDAPDCGLPLAWDLRDIQSHVQVRRAGERGCRFVEEMRASGMCSGICWRMAVPAPVGGHAYVSFTSTAPHRQWITETVLGQALTLGLCMHEFLLQHVRRPDAPLLLPPLGALRQDILRCLGQGQSNKQVARQLGVSLNAVDYHLRHLRRQFGVRNRTQLVLAAQAWQGGC